MRLGASSDDICAVCPLRTALEHPLTAKIKKSGCVPVHVRPGGARELLASQLNRRHEREKLQRYYGDRSQQKETMCGPRRRGTGSIQELYT